ncbi:biotin transporter BioY [Texcoconibacillus texcoconensis]|uniref:Biotin transporter n=1 Tax=Texcoconibacillus texcoconensis TaxID=1095777 RepID=A0A840QQI8_9BACI|nr:biotin transporter BioY [Texcoconibacillus texcoconensis]MBB5173567.1 biotin transport system substrate-specific component [Texcoconibacillus texcoconensis]
MQKTSLRPIDITLVALFAAMMAIGANVTSMITIGTVPLTLQTLIATLAGILLGSRLGALSMIVYTALGLMGPPIFAQMSGGLQTLASPTFGFILSFIIMAFVAGKITEKSDNPSYRTFALAGTVALLINYLLGVHYFHYFQVFVLGLEDMRLAVSWSVMLPLLIKDAILTATSVSVLPRIYYAVQRSNKATYSHKQTST